MRSRRLLLCRDFAFAEDSLSRLRDSSLKEGASVPVSRRDYKWVEDPAVTPADMAY